MPPSQLPTKPDIFFKNKTSCKVPGVSTRTGWCFTLGTSIKLLDPLSQNLTLSKNGDLKRIYSSFFLKKSRGDFLKNSLHNCFFGFHFVLVTTFHICLNHSYVPAFFFLVDTPWNHVQQTAPKKMVKSWSFQTASLLLCSKAPWQAGIN